MEQLNVAQSEKNASASKEKTIDSCAKRFTLSDIYMILSTKNKVQDVVLSDRRTKLLDLLLIMNDYAKFSDFLQKLKDVNLIIPFNSPIWAGYNLLHLCLSLNEKLYQDIIQSDLPDTTETACGQYHWTEEEVNLYYKRVELCLECGCSVSMKNAKEQTPIHLAFSILRETAIVEKLLNCCEDNIVDENGLSHLHIACALGHLDAAKKCLKSGADVNSCMRVNFNWDEKCLWCGIHMINVRMNSTPLHVAVAFGNNKLVEYLLENNADVYAEDSLELTPIHLVMSIRDKDHLADLARLFFNKFPNLRDSVSKAGLSHLHVAANIDDKKAAERMLRQGAWVDRVVEANVKEPAFLAELAGKTPLHVARNTSDGEVIKALLNGGANVHAKDREGLSMLQYSVCDLDDMWTTPLVRMLKNGKCDVGTSGVTMLHFACGRQDIKWAKKLLKNGADVNARISTKGKLQGATSLYILLRSSLIHYFPQIVIALVNLLLNSGADVTMECCNGYTPLNLLFEQIHKDFHLDDYLTQLLFILQIADLLLEAQKSYNVNHACDYGSHFHFACMRNKVDIVNKFLDNGVNVNESTYLDEKVSGGLTPLHFALAYGSKEVAYVLLERGADVNAKDARDNTPLHAAIKRKFIDLQLIETILSRGADINAINLDGESLLHCLLKSSDLTLERLNFFLDRGCFLDIHHEIIGLAMLSAAPTDFQPFLERLAQVFEVKSAIHSGFNVIRSIVAVAGHNGMLTVDNYFSAIEFLMGIGCELNQQDTEGRTALHQAVSFYNLEAVDALLHLGADVNIADYKNNCPFSDNVIMTANTSNEFRKIGVVEVLARHIWKLKFAGLNVNDSNLQCLQKVEIPSVSALKQSCQYEIAKAKETEVDQFLTAEDFLSELGAITRYRRICIERRAIVDKFFKRTAKLRQEFPEFSGLLALQYRKAAVRLELLQPGKEVIVLLCQTELPDLCLEHILGFFTNNELKIVIELAEQLFNYS